jgi:hypothetical protein
VNLKYAISYSATSIINANSSLVVANNKIILTGICGTLQQISTHASLYYFDVISPLPPHNHHELLEYFSWTNSVLVKNMRSHTKN